ncbi:MAG: hypothetical protein AAF533_24485 [Acidobacteriota bacterium]
MNTSQNDGSRRWWMVMGTALLLGALSPLRGGATPSLDWSTFLGVENSLGQNGGGVGNVLAFGADGMLYIGGGVDQPGLATPGAAREAGSGGFVAKLDPVTRSFVWFTYVGDDGEAGRRVRDLVVDDEGRVTFVSECFDGVPLVDPFWVAPPGVDPDCEGYCPHGCVGRLSADGSSFDFLSNIGRPWGLTTLSDGSTVVVGSAYKDIPIVDAVQPDRMRYPEGFVTRIAPDGDALMFSTYFGNGSMIRFIGAAADAQDNLYLAGQGSTGYPLLDPFHAEPPGDGTGAVLASFTLDGALRWSTWLPGSSRPHDLLVDPGGEIHVSVDTDTDAPDEFLPVDWFRERDPSDQGGLFKLTSDGQTVRHAGTVPHVPTGLTMDDHGALIASLDVRPGSGFEPIDDGGLHSGGGVIDGGAMRFTPAVNGIDWFFGVGGSESAAEEGELFPPSALTYFRDVVYHEGSVMVLGDSNCVDFPFEEPIETNVVENGGVLMAVSGLAGDDVPEPSSVDAHTWRVPLDLAHPRGTNALDLTWDETMGGRYRVVVGDLDVLAQTGSYAHQPVGPCVIEDTSIRLDLPTGNVYYLILGVDENGTESSYGRNSQNQERPPSVEECTDL